ncbi:Endoribonuclease L-PSP/chorismate mutase-like protein [Aspergillus venezuelensis]
MPGQFAPVFTPSAPTPLPQFSQAVVYNGLVYCSGNVGVKPGEGFDLVKGTAKDRTLVTRDVRDSGLICNAILFSQRQIFTNIRAVLQAAGSNIDNIFKVNIFLTTMDDFSIVNEAYDEFFTQGTKPARTCVAVHQLPFGTDVEIECIAHLDKQ